MLSALDIPMKEFLEEFGPHRTKLPMSFDILNLAQSLHYVSHDTQTRFIGDDNDIINDTWMLFE